MIAGSNDLNIVETLRKDVLRTLPSLTDPEIEALSKDDYRVGIVSGEAHEVGVWELIRGTFGHSSISLLKISREDDVKGLNGRKSTLTEAPAIPFPRCFKTDCRASEERRRATGAFRLQYIKMTSGGMPSTLVLL